MQDLENQFHLSYREVKAVFHFIAEDVVEIVNFKLRQYPNKCRKDQKLFRGDR